MAEPPGHYTAFANRVAPKDRPPSAAELWHYRCTTARDGFTPEQQVQFVRLIHDTLAVRARGERRQGDSWGWEPVADEDRERVEREIWAEIGELCGVGPPPRVS
jgi:hypothetical protein